MGRVKYRTMSTCASYFLLLQFWDSWLVAYSTPKYSNVDATNHWTGLVQTCPCVTIINFKVQRSYTCVFLAGWRCSFLGQVCIFVSTFVSTYIGKCLLYEMAMGGVDNPIFVGDSRSSSEHSGSKPSSPCPSTSWSALRMLQVSPAKIVDLSELR